ncbi:MAG: hypothetical protein JNJ73_04575 [Hyphomonadaceae bacterium]|nr:hypothetical protein [Hyphomonadaceae bacterium]
MIAAAFLGQTRDWWLLGFVLFLTLPVLAFGYGLYRADKERKRRDGPH